MLERVSSYRFSAPRKARAAVKPLALTAALLVACVCSAARADLVAVFDNAAYVDTSGGTTAESDTLQASLTSLGHTVSTFTGITASAFAAAGAGADVLVIPELENGNLIAALDATAKAAIAAYVAGGGALIMMGVEGQSRDVDFLNGVFGFSLVAEGTGTDRIRNAAATAGTIFDSPPDTLPQHIANGFSGAKRSSLPPGALDFYTDGANITQVFAADYGVGRIGFLGWDWFEAKPLGAFDGGWLTTLDRMVQYTAEPIPAPGAALLAVAGLTLIPTIRRRHAAQT